MSFVSLFGQMKKPLTINEYDKWYQFYQSKLSPNARWMTYIIQNPVGKDTMVLLNTNNLSKSIIMGGKEGQFSPQSDYFVFLKDSTLYYQNLATGKKDSLISIDSYQFTKGGKHILATRNKTEILIYELMTNDINTFPFVVSHKVSPDSTKIGLVQQTENGYQLGVLNLNLPLIPFKIAFSKEKITGMTWNGKQNAIAFLEAQAQINSRTPQYQVNYVSFNESQTHIKGTKKMTAQIPTDYDVPTSRLFFSSDDEELFFDIKPFPGNEQQQEKVIVWSSAATILPPPPQNNEKTLLMCWGLKANNTSLVDGDRTSLIIPTANGKHAVVIDSANYGPFFDDGGVYVDLYLKQLKTGLKKLIAEKVSHQKNHITLSPYGKYITWFKNQQWWIYDVALDKTSCLTCSVQAQFENVDHDYAGDQYPNDKPFWIGEDEAILLTDYYDVWCFEPKRKSIKKVTNGRINKSKFRVYDSGLFRPYRNYFFSYMTRAFESNSYIILKEINTKTLAEGFSVFNLNKPLQQVLYVEDAISSIQEVNESFIYVLSDFDKSPELVFQSNLYAPFKIIQKSNEHQKEYFWGKSELIYYNVKGMELKGALFYPADYNPNQEYPLIVQIYQKPSAYLREYVPPSLNNSIGFNISIYTMANYFVLYPDINYTINTPGESALECVSAAVDKAIETTSIDGQNIGLMGHSFGGWEVSYILSQTQRFKTGVAGSGFHDLIGTYLGTDDNNVSSMWRFEIQQLRMTDPYYSQTFLQNSPIMQAYQIETPLLLWASTGDSRVNWNNSSKLQMALWRLRKESTLLVYPNDYHFIMDKENQIDLSTKMMQWFNFYLKGEVKPEWIEKK